MECFGVGVVMPAVAQQQSLDQLLRKHLGETDVGNFGTMGHTVAIRQPFTRLHRCLVAREDVGALEVRVDHSSLLVQAARG